MPTLQEIERAKQTCRSLPEAKLRRRRAAIQSEMSSMARIGEQSDAADRWLEMLEVAERILSEELRERHEKEAI